MTNKIYQVVLFLLQYQVVLTVKKSLGWDHSNDGYLAALGTVYYPKQYGSDC